MIRPALACALLGLLLSGCSHPSPAVVFHTLRPIENPEPVPTRTPLALEIMPVQLPELLQRSQLVLLDGQGVHRLSPTHRWGNTLEKDMQRVLAENLSALLGSDAIVHYPLGDQVKASHRLALEVQQCDGAPGGTLQFRATWMLTKNDRMVLLRRFNVQEPVPGGSVEDLASAHSRVMDSLSREIAKELMTLP